MSEANKDKKHGSTAKKSDEGRWAEHSVGPDPREEGWGKARGDGGAGEGEGEGGMEPAETSWTAARVPRRSATVLASSTPA